MGMDEILERRNDYRKKWLETLAALALCVMAYASFQEHRAAVAWRAARPEREAAERARVEELAELNASLIMDRVMTAVVKEAEEDAAEEAGNDRRYMLDRLARNRALLECPIIPPHVRTDVHEIPAHFNDYLGGDGCI